MKLLLSCTVAGILALHSAPARATDLTIKLAGSEAVTRAVVTFNCGPEGPALGLPAKPFVVEYLNGAGNSLAIVPVREQSLIFVSVPSASGARYASGTLIWWDAGARGVHLSSDLPDAKKQVSCRKIGGGL